MVAVCFQGSSVVCSLVVASLDLFLLLTASLLCRHKAHENAFDTVCDTTSYDPALHDTTLNDMVYETAGTGETGLDFTEELATLWLGDLPQDTSEADGTVVRDRMSQRRASTHAHTPVAWRCNTNDETEERDERGDEADREIAWDVNRWREREVWG